MERLTRNDRLVGFFKRKYWKIIRVAMAPRVYGPFKSFRKTIYKPRSRNYPSNERKLSQTETFVHFFWYSLSYVRLKLINENDFSFSISRQRIIIALTVGRSCLRSS